MINVLVNAYACAPNMGSEPGMAWNWIVNLARYCRLHVITEGEWQTEIETVMATLEVKENVTFYYLPVTDEIRHMCWNQGDWRFYYHYRKWQKRALKLGQTIVKKEPIDVVHQLNMIGFREPGYFWKIKSKPFVWGPLDAKEKFPLAYAENAGLKVKAFIRLKNLITKGQLMGAQRVRKAVSHAEALFAASSNTREALLKYFGKDAILLNETGCYPSKAANVTFSKEGETLNLLWVGKFDFRKQLELALEVIAKLKHLDVALHVVGKDDGEEGKFYKQMAANLGIQEKCIWYGLIPHARVQELMRSSDVFFFTSVAEGTPHVVLEAIGNRLPVVCFNTCGQGDVVDESVGAKINLSTPEKSIAEFSELLEGLFHNRARILQFSEACEAHQLKHSWTHKAEVMLDTYKNILAK